MLKKPEDQDSAGGSLYDNLSLESLGVHQFFGEVDGEKAVSACEFILKSNLIQSDLSNLTLILNTVGGECSEGFAVIDMMDASRIPVATVGVGNIMSMGVLMLTAGKHGLRSITKNTDVMAHQFAGYFHGKQHELIATQTSFLMLEERFFRHFLRHSKMTKTQIKDILFSPSDRYLTPAECLKYGLVDRVVDHATTPPAKPDARKKVVRARKAAAR
jgi:ATP-dependent Clp protease protease subunit